MVSAYQDSDCKAGEEEPIDMSDSDRDRDHGEGEGHGAEELRDIGGRVRQDLGDLREAAQRNLAALFSDWRRFVERNPELALGGAFGVGFLLSGAIVSRTTARLVRAALRIYLRRLSGLAVGYLAGELRDLARGVNAAATTTA